MSSAILTLRFSYLKNAVIIENWKHQIQASFNGWKPKFKNWFEQSEVILSVCLSALSCMSIGIYLMGATIPAWTRFPLYISAPILVACWVIALKILWLEKAWQKENFFRNLLTGIGLGVIIGSCLSIIIYIPLYILQNHPFIN